MIKEKKIELILKLLDKTQERKQSWSYHKETIGGAMLPVIQQSYRHVYETEFEDLLFRIREKRSINPLLENVNLTPISSMFFQNDDSEIKSKPDGDLELMIINNGYQVERFNGTTGLSDLYNTIQYIEHGGDAYKKIDHFLES